MAPTRRPNKKGFGKPTGNSVFNLLSFPDPTKRERNVAYWHEADVAVVSLLREFLSPAPAQLVASVHHIGLVAQSCE
jgi:hypothetical protein